jgi:hypothetical protein
VDESELNAPRWPDGPRDGFYEAWYVVANEPRAGLGLWVRYAVDVSASGAQQFALWGSWFERDRLERNFALKNVLPAAAISRSSIGFGNGELTSEACSGEVEGGGHALRWRLSFGRGVPAEDGVPAWLRPVARARGSGFTWPHPASTVSGAVEVDGRMIELTRAPAGQAHMWGRKRWPGWVWARCNSFAEDPEASIDLYDVIGPGGVRVPTGTLRLRGEVHRFGGLPWIAFFRSQPAAPVWHFSARDARLAIDGVVRAAPEQMVQVQYPGHDGSLFHCVNSETASMEVRVRSRALPGASFRDEITLTSRGAASLEFCGRAADARVTNLLAVAAAREKAARSTGSVAS